MLFQTIIGNGKMLLPRLISSNIRSMSVKSTFLQIEELGEPHKVLKKCETQLDSPKDNEVLVKILASPINPAVINIMQGNINFFLNGTLNQIIFYSKNSIFHQGNTVKVQNYHSSQAMKQSLKY